VAAKPRRKKRFSDRRETKTFTLKRENNLEINPKETNTSEETDESIQDFEILQNRHATELGSPEDR
jgi:hypothetical protein